MSLWFHKVTRGEKSGLIPDDDEGRALMRRMGDGECCQVKIIRPRSVQWNKMYFGICTQIGENQDPPRTKESIDYELRIRAGHFETLWVDGHECRQAKRIAFDQLTADEWSALWPSLELAIVEHFGEEYIQERAA
jgi:hypothetical protein